MNRQADSSVSNYLQSFDKQDALSLNPTLIIPNNHTKRKKKKEELFETKSTKTQQTRLNTLQTHSEVLPKSSKCGIEVYLALVLTITFSVLLGVSISFANKNAVPSDIRLLLVDEFLTNNVSIEKSIFYDVIIPSNSIACFGVISADESLDPRMKLIERPNRVLELNDDVSTDNKNPILFFGAGDRDLELVLEIETIEGEGEITVQSVLVEELVKVNEIFLKNISSDEIVVSLLKLDLGETYEIVAYHIDNNLDELDAAIRVRDIEGNEVIEAFQSSITEFTPRTVFTATEGLELVILEVRMIVKNIDPELRILVRPLGEELNQPFNQTNPTPLFLFRQRPTYVELDVVQNTQYSITLVHNLPTEEFEFTNGDPPITFANILGPAPIILDNGVILTALSSEVLPGVSCRVYDKQSNEVLARDRTNLRIESVEPFVGTNRPLEPNEFFDDITFSDNGTLIQFLAKTTGKVVLEVARFNINHRFYTSVEEILNLFGPFAAFLISIEETIVDISDVGLVDENDLYPTCDIDQTKHIIGDDTCEQGIVLFCRNDIFPAIDTSNATRKEFETICDCAEFLCATLPGGNDVDQQLFSLFNVFYGAFSVIAVIGMLIYFISLCNLFCFGGFEGYIDANTGCGTWTMATLFMMTSFVYFSTKIVISGELKGMAEISANFDLNRIPIPSDEFQYNYYDEIFISDVLGINIIGDIGVDLVEGDTFLNEEALRALPDTTFADLQRLVITNLVFAIFKDVLAIITFLDVSIVWLESTRFTALNRAARKQQIMKFKWVVRAIEGLYFLALVIILALVTKSNGQAYSVTQNVLLLLLSTFIIVVYCMGRARLKFYFVTSKISSGYNSDSSSIWKVIRNVSSYVIAANIGVLFVQIYFITVQNFDELVSASNDPIYLTISLFQDMCMFIGQMAIFSYLFRAYWKFRDSLFEVKTEYATGEKIKHTMEETTFVTNEKLTKGVENIEDLF